MKKNKLALAVALSITSIVANAAPAPGSLYVGGKLGFSQFFSTDSAGLEDYGFSVANVKKNNFSTALLVGYQADNYLAFEFGLDWLGDVKYQLDDSSDDVKERVWGGQFSIKGSYPLPVENLDIYARVGAFFANATVNMPDNSEHYFSVAPMGALGLSYAINDKISGQIEYQYISAIESGYDGLRNADNGRFSLGVTYNLGSLSSHCTSCQSKNYTSQPEITAAKNTNIKTNQVNLIDNSVVKSNVQEWNLSIDVLFPFGSTVLTAEGKKLIDDLLNTLVQKNTTINIVNVSPFEVVGFADRIGPKEYNLKLSKARAKAVKNYLISKGVSTSDINAVGKGVDTSMTGSSCADVNVRKALVSCLSPDRRVGVSVEVQYISK